MSISILFVIINPLYLQYKDQPNIPNMQLFTQLFSFDWRKLWTVEDR